MIKRFASFLFTLGGLTWFCGGNGLLTEGGSDEEGSLPFLPCLLELSEELRLCLSAAGPVGIAGEGTPERLGRRSGCGFGSVLFSLKVGGRSGMGFL